MNYQKFYNKLTLVNKIELIFIIFVGSYGIFAVITGRNITMGFASFIVGLLYLLIIFRELGYFDKKEKIKFVGSDLSNEPQ